MRFANKPSLHIWYQLVDSHGNILEPIHDGWVAPSTSVEDVRDVVYPDIYIRHPVVVDAGQLSLYREKSDVVTGSELPRMNPISLYHTSQAEPLIVCVWEIGAVPTQRPPILRTESEKYVGRIIEKFNFFYEVEKGTDSKLSLDNIIKARNGTEGIEWKFKVAQHDVCEYDAPNEPPHIVMQGHQLTHRKLNDPYSDSEWRFLESIAVELNKPYTDIFTQKTSQRLRFLSCESFWDL